jgi:dTDP-4-amino-4,6-dideoxygalactose transaminase
MKFLPYGRQEITQSDKDAVMSVLESDFITQGPEVERFASSVGSYSQAQYAVAVNSATSALHLACLALGVVQGDLVWTSPITFVASANCARLCGADVDFVDVDPGT